MLARGFGGVARWGLGRPDAALAIVLQAVEAARRIGHSYSLSLALTIGLSLVRFRRGEIDEAAAALDEAIAIATENQFPYFLARAIAMRGLIETRLGQIEIGLRHLNEGIAAFRQRGGVATVPMMLVWLADGQLSAGDPSAARVALNEGLDLLARTGEASHSAEIHRLLGRAARDLGEIDEAGRCFRAAYDLAEGQGALGWRLRAALDLAVHLNSVGEYAAAEACVRTALGAIEGGAETADVRAAHRLLARAAAS